jgi:hypothetical protein
VIWVITKAPIYYFEGHYDFPSPAAGSRDHFAKQSRTTRYYLSLDGGGHGALSDDLPKGACIEGLSAAIAANQNPGAATAQCAPAMYELKVGTPGGSPSL